MFSQKHNKIITNLLQNFIFIFTKMEKNMHFILEEMKIDLGNTEVENIFIDDYMPLATGNYVKVYLLGYKYACDFQSNFNNETLAKNLKLEISEIHEAWNYWEKEGIILKNSHIDDDNYEVKFINLKQLYIDKVYKHVANNEASYVDNEELLSFNRNLENKKMMEEIEDIMGRPLKISEKHKIVSWLNKYKTKTDIMTQAFSYSINNKKIKRFNYIESVVSAWHDENIDTIDKMMEYLEKRNDRYFTYSRLSKALGFNRILTEAEMRIVDKWIDEWKFTVEMILKSFDNSTKINNPNLNYFDKILSDWHNNGLKEIDDLKKEKTEEKKAKTEKEKIKVNKFHNFDQKIKDYSEQELEEIVKKRFKQKLNSLGLTVPGGEKVDEN